MPVCCQGVSGTIRSHANKNACKKPFFLTFLTKIGAVSCMETALLLGMGYAYAR